jgi:Na+-translocating ferredoxin:NAD+ oxidoreductase RnfA subunit
MTLDYFAKAASAWFLGFFPFLEIYLAVPAALAMGLDTLSAIVWPALGNYAPVPLIVFFYAQLRKLPRVGPWLERRASSRAKRLLDWHGVWFILLATPWIGVWAVAATVQALGMDRNKLLVYSLVSIVLYATMLALLIQLGIDWLRSE